MTSITRRELLRPAITAVATPALAWKFPQRCRHLTRAREFEVSVDPTHAVGCPMLLLIETVVSVRQAIKFIVVNLGYPASGIEHLFRPTHEVALAVERTAIRIRYNFHSAKCVVMNCGSRNESRRYHHQRVR